jgi:hypothetical protein
MEVYLPGQMFSLESHKGLYCPRLFIIFINDKDLAIDVTGSFLFKFADGTKVGMVVETEDQRDELQAAITNLEQWSQEWQMMFNTDRQGDA